MRQKGRKDAKESLREYMRVCGGQRQVNSEDRDRKKTEQTELKNNDK